MGHSYRKKRDSNGTLLYSKYHENGEQTKVQADKVGTRASGGTSWLVNVKDPNGDRRIGKFDTKRDAKRAMRRWMNNHPKGVQGPGGAMGAMNAMNEGVESIFDGGGLFK